jgi:hypothetical protein
LCQLLAASGCIAVSGGLEVASDRLLQLIDKGVSVEQVAQVTRNFTESGIMVHSYLMYGYPTQTIQETVDSLEMVRQMFELGIIQSGFWHQFALTAHSPIGLNPEAYNIIPHKKEITFANNEIAFTDKTGIDHSKFSFGLKKSLFNFMHGLCFESQLQEWFDFKIPKTKVDKDYIANCLENEAFITPKPNSKIVWLSNCPTVNEKTKNKKGQILELLEMTFHTKNQVFEISVEKEKGTWLLTQLALLQVKNDKTATFSSLEKSFEEHFPDFLLFWHSKPVDKLRENGLLVL